MSKHNENEDHDDSHNDHDDSVVAIDPVNLNNSGLIKYQVYDDSLSSGLNDDYIASPLPVSGLNDYQNIDKVDDSPHENKVSGTDDNSENHRHDFTGGGVENNGLISGVSNDNHHRNDDSLNSAIKDDSIVGSSVDDNATPTSETNSENVSLSSDNTISGTTGKDILKGSRNDDHYIVNHRADKILEVSEAGHDSVLSRISYKLDTNVEDLTLTGANRINATGNQLDNTITGNNGNNSLKGMEGDDILIGGLGSDKLLGGLGADVFTFNNIDESGTSNKTRDKIIDFKIGEDKIDLSAIFTDNEPTESFAFVENQSFNSIGQFYFDSKKHILYANTDGDSEADFSIQVNGVQNLGINDLILL